MSLPFTQLSDRDLLDVVKRLASDERQATARLIACLAEVDARRLYLGEGCSSLFTYCTQVLHLSEHAAYARIEAARAARRFPAILDRLTAGGVTLTAVGLLAPHLTPDNHVELLDAARHRSKRDVEHLVASIRPQPSVPSSVRKLPVAASRPAAGTSLRHHAREEQFIAMAEAAATSISATHRTPAAPQHSRAVVAPVSAERYKVQFTVDMETFRKLGRVQDLMRHRVPTGDVAVIFSEAVTMLLRHLEKTKLAIIERPRAPRGTASGSRTIPAAVRRAVWTRDGGRCAFIGAHGRCAERGFLEFHHVDPYAAGGQATISNVQLRCRAHNEHEADRDFPHAPLQARERQPLFSSW